MPEPDLKKSEQFKKLKAKRKKESKFQDIALYNSKIRVK
jgi:hypothetical protein